MDVYDEDILDNVFFTTLQERYPDLYETAAENRWMICVPRTGVDISKKYVYTRAEFESHILAPVVDKPSIYRTLVKKEVVIDNNIITTGEGFQEPRAAQILFEETFFNKNEESFRVLCISIPLEGGPADLLDSVPVAPLQSLDDCVDLLWGHTGHRKTQRQLDNLVSIFQKSYGHMEGESLRSHMDAVNALFTRAMQIVLKDSYLKRTARQNKAFMDNLKIAVETYVMHKIYRKLFKGISACLATKDSHLNKITRNLSELQLRDLGIRAEFCQNVPRARKEVNNLAKYSTPMGKLHCVRRLVKALMQPPKPLNKGPTKDEQLALTTDDLLPILLFLVVKSEMPNWWAHFTYMTSFRFSKSSNDDEFGFYLASLEAALEHVSSGQLNTVKIGAANPTRVQLSVSPMANSTIPWQRQDSVGDGTNIDLLFQNIRTGDEEAVARLLSQDQQVADITRLQLCHPLCSCDNCEKLLSRSRSDSHAVTAFSRDDRGFTALHMAAMVGNASMTDLLIRRGAVVNGTDYHGSTPLHISCQKGHQSVALLLLHYKAAVNLADNDGNTPLHLCTANGHEDCVKALIYYETTSSILDVNVGNDFGDTPLHLAAKWGYEAIVDILLENGAWAEAKNRRKVTPVQCAHNVKVSRLLATAAAQEAAQQDDFTRIESSTIVGITAVSQHKVDKKQNGTLATVVPNKSSEKLQVYRQVEILLKSVADGDMELVKFYLGWAGDFDVDDDDDCIDVTRQQLCHPLCQCQKCQPLQKVTTSTPSGLNVNSANREGFAPLHVASLHGHSQLATLLLKRGANMNAKNKTQECSPLHLACQHNRPAVVLTLVEHGSKVNARDCRGNTPLHYCSINGAQEAAQILLQNGASVGQANTKGNTPLHEAAKWNNLPVLRHLLLNGASVNVRNKQHLSPLQLTQSDDVLRMLHAARHGDLSAIQQPVLASKTKKEERGMKSTIHHVSFRELLAAFEEEDLKQLKSLVTSVQKFDKRHELRHTPTRDRSAPRLDDQLKHQLFIKNFDHRKLRRTNTIDKSTPFYTIDDTDPTNFNFSAPYEESVTPTESKGDEGGAVGINNEGKSEGFSGNFKVKITQSYPGPDAKELEDFREGKKKEQKGNKPKVIVGDFADGEAAKVTDALPQEVENQIPETENVKDVDSRESSPEIAETSLCDPPLADTELNEDNNATVNTNENTQGLPAIIKTEIADSAFSESSSVSSSKEERSDSLDSADTAGSLSVRSRTVSSVSYSNRSDTSLQAELEKELNYLTEANTDHS